MQFRFACLAVIAMCLQMSTAMAEDTVEEIVQRALKARCENPELLKKQKVEIITLEGKIFQNGEEIATIREMKCDGPNRSRWDNDLTYPTGKKNKAIMTLSGASGWQLWTGVPVHDMSFSEVDEFKMEIYGRYFATLIPLKEKTTVLTKMPDTMVGDEPAWVIRATQRFRPEIFLSFNKKSAQLLRIVYKAREAGIEWRKEHHFFDYKDMTGLVLPTKLVDMRQQSGMEKIKSAEFTIKYKFPDKLGEEEFAKPEKK